MRRAAFLPAIIFVALTGCGKPENRLPDGGLIVDPCPGTPDKPCMDVDRLEVSFGLEFGRAVYVGTRPEESLQITNAGKQTLTINPLVEFTGDQTFTFEGPTKLELKTRERAYMRIIFAPNRAGIHAASISLNSNATNTPVRVGLRGCAIPPPPDGGSIDAGTSGNPCAQ